MLDNDRTLIAQMIESFGKQARVEQLVLLDRTGVQRYSSPPGTTGMISGSALPPARPATAIRRSSGDRAASSRLAGGAILQHRHPDS